MEYLIFGILILLIFLAGWDLFTDIADRQRGNNFSQPAESEFVEEI